MGYKLIYGSFFFFGATGHVMGSANSDSLYKRICRIINKAAIFQNCIPTASFVRKYLEANPDPLDAIPDDFVPQHDEGEIGSGVSGSIYPVTNSGMVGEFIVKKGKSGNEADIDKEADIGRYIRDVRHNITPETQFAAIQGLELVVPGKNLADGSLIQERIQGQILYSYSKKRIDIPRALEHLCVLANSVYALEMAGINHGDLHSANIMMEKRRLPEEVIVAKVKAIAREMTGITGEESDLTDEDRQVLNAAKEAVTANLTDEDQYEYVPRIIDFGFSGRIGDDGSINMLSFGALMPILLFGKDGARKINILQYGHALPMRLEFNRTARGEVMQTKKSSGNPQDQSALAIMSLEEYSAKLNEEINTKRVDIEKTLFRSAKQTDDELQRQIDSSQRQVDEINQQIADKSQTYSRTYGESMEKYKMRFKIEVQKIADAKMSQYINEKFHEVNDAMKAATGKSYPEPVLGELVRIMANCISDDPIKCLTAAEVLKRITDLTFSDWSSGNYTIQPEIIQRNPNGTSARERFWGNWHKLWPIASPRILQHIRRLQKFFERMRDRVFFS
ncbi:MAG: hypothetical protein LBB05_03410 [Puniceicoccales bacterium]|jgi:predicted Ser/Thr protein kinase|nr:hypothetical protein [Puniceicoccales bacterium]